MLRSTATETAVKTLFPVVLLQQGLAKDVAATSRGDLSETGSQHCALCPVDMPGTLGCLLPVKPPDLTWGAVPLECPRIRNAAHNYACLLLPHLLDIMKVFEKLKVLQQ